MSDTVIKIEHLQKHFGKLQVLNDINFQITKGQVVTIIGSSGSGKSTMLRCINLLEVPDGGKIYYEGKDILGGDLDVTKYRSKVCMVFQSFNLFNNKNVLDRINYRTNSRSKYKLDIICLYNCRKGK